MISAMRIWVARLIGLTVIALTLGRIGVDLSGAGPEGGTGAADQQEITEKLDPPDIMGTDR